MPVLNPGASEFAGFAVDNEFESVLPDERLMSGGAVSSFYRNLTAETSVNQQWKNFSRLSRISVANVAMTAGLPGDRLGALTHMFESAPRVTPELIEAMLRDPVMKGALLLFDEALEVVATDVPIVGWVVQIGLFFYNLIRLAVKGAEKAPPQAQASAIAYNKSSDVDLTRILLEELKRDNWTKLFLPQQKPAELCVKTLAYTARGGVDGYVWEICKPDAVGNWGWGLTPGLSSEFTGIVGAYQSPRKLIGSPRDAGIESITPFGALHPSVVQLGMTVWQMCLNNSPNAFRINGTRIVSAWKDNYAELYDMAWWQDDDWLRKQIVNSATWYQWDAPADTVLDRSRVSRFDGNGLLQPEDIPDRYHTSNLSLYSDLIDYIVNEKWRSRLSGFLETLTVAYVPPNAPALKADSGLKQKYKDMRALLLRHRARYDVELDLIPDEDYRAAVRDATRTIAPVFQAGGGRGPKPAMLNYVAQIDPELPPPPVPGPDGNPGPGLSPSSEEATSAGILTLLGVGGVLAVAAAVARR